MFLLNCSLLLVGYFSHIIVLISTQIKTQGSPLQITGLLFSLETFQYFIRLESPGIFQLSGDNWGDYQVPPGVSFSELQSGIFPDSEVWQSQRLG